MPTQIEHVNELHQLEKDKWFAIRTYLCLPRDAATYSRNAFGKRYPALSGESAPRVRKTRVIYHPSGIKYTAMVMLYYQTPRVPGKMRIQVLANGRWVESVRDRKDKLILGTVPKNDGQEYLVVKGDRNRQEYDFVVKIETAYPSSGFNLTDILRLKGCTNSDDFQIPGFGTAYDGTMVLDRLGVDWVYGEDLVDIDYYLRWSGPSPFPKWNEQLKVQKGTWIIQQTQVVDKDGDIVEGELQKRDVFACGRIWDYPDEPDERKKLVDSEVEARAMFPDKAFGPVFQGLVMWDQESG